MTNGSILLLGANGQVGHEALPLLRALGNVEGVQRADLDLTDAGRIRETVRALRPRWIVNAAAYTAVDKAESDPKTAFAVNGDAPGILGEEALRLGAAVIHFSTDYVFSGMVAGRGSRTMQRGLSASMELRSWRANAR